MAVNGVTAAAAALNGLLSGVNQTLTLPWQIGLSLGMILLLFGQQTLRLMGTRRSLLLSRLVLLAAAPLVGLYCVMVVGRFAAMGAVR